MGGSAKRRRSGKRAGDQQEEGPNAAQVDADTVAQIITLLDVDCQIGTAKSLQLVSKVWAAAVGAATTSINVHRCTDVLGMQHWVSKYAPGLQLEELHVQYTGKASLKRLSVLPYDEQLQLCSLRSLQLHRVPVQLGGSSSFSSSLAAATRLSSVSLRDITFHLSTGAPQKGDPCILPALAALPDLKQLSLCNIKLHGKKQRAGKGGKVISTTVAVPVSVPDQFLQHLTLLTQLELSTAAGGLSDAAVQDIGSLSKLQYLVLGAAGSQLSPAAISGLQNLQALTSLQLSDVPFCIDLEDTPFLSKLTALRSLVLAAPKRRFGLHASVLAALTGLQRLGLINVILCGDDAASALLSCLRGMSCLTELQLCGLDGLCPGYEGGEALPPQQYTALTAHSTLQRLQLKRLNLPKDAWEHIFAFDRPLQLTKLQLQDGAVTYIQVAESCPDLRQLDAEQVHCRPGDGIYRSAGSLYDLAHLPHLTSLSATVHVHEGILGVQYLTALKALRLTAFGGMWTTHLPACTKLKQLTYLGLDR